MATSLWIMMTDNIHSSEFLGRLALILIRLFAPHVYPITLFLLLPQRQRPPVTADYFIRDSNGLPACFKFKFQPDSTRFNYRSMPDFVQLVKFVCLLIQSRYGDIGTENHTTLCVLYTRSWYSNNNPIPLGSENPPIPQSLPGC